MAWKEAAFLSLLLNLSMTNLVRRVGKFHLVLYRVFFWEINTKVSKSKYMLLQILWCIFKLVSKILRISIANIIDCTIQNLRLWKPYPAYDKKTFSPSNELWTEKKDPATKEISWEPNVEPTWESSSKSFIKYEEPVSRNLSSFFGYSHINKYTQYFIYLIF